eukprot:m.351294 g.351294  ORF g.351294 m.351294 type:complete len:134 (-) comp16214_c0_seq1:56-457(-)
MVAPVNKRPVIKKRTKAFKRYHSDRYHRVGESWRAPHGIDGKFRRRFRGHQSHVKIGFGNNKATRHMMPSGFYKFTVNNVEELNMLLMHNRRYAAEIASSVGRRNRAAIVERAKALNIKLTNGKAKLVSEESE